MHSPLESSLDKFSKGIHIIEVLVNELQEEQIIGVSWSLCRQKAVILTVIMVFMLICIYYICNSALATMEVRTLL